MIFCSCFPGIIQIYFFLVSSTFFNFVALIPPIGHRWVHCKGDGDDISNHLLLYLKKMKLLVSGYKTQAFTLKELL
jgi:hypothetical protein